MANIKTPDGGFYVDEQQFDVDYHKKAVSVKGAALQQDYAQNDPNAPDYIKNRPFYNNPNISWKYKGSFEDEEIVEAEIKGKKTVFVKVSDDAPGKEDILGAEMISKLPNGDESHKVITKVITEDDIEIIGEDAMAVDEILIANKDVSVQVAENLFVNLSKGAWVSVILDENGHNDYLSEISLTKFNKSTLFFYIIGPQIFYRKSQITNNQYRIGINESDNKELEIDDYTPALVHALSTGAVCYTEDNKTHIEAVTDVKFYTPTSGSGTPQGIVILTSHTGTEYVIGQPMVE